MQPQYGCHIDDMISFRYSTTLKNKSFLFKIQYYKSQIPERPKLYDLINPHAVGILPFSGNIFKHFQELFTMMLFTKMTQTYDLTTNLNLKLDLAVKSSLKNFSNLKIIMYPFLQRTS